MKVAVLGAGAWGTALGVLLASKGVPTALWARRKEFAEDLRARRENKDYLPGVALPAYLYPTADPEEALEGAELAVVALPSKALEETLRGLPLAPWYLSATKGLFFQEGRLRTPSEVVEDLAGRPVAVLSGPNHAEEVARFLPTASVAAGPLELAKWVQELFSGPTFRVYTSRDRRGVELGGALKNILALAAGMVDGLRLGDNAKAALLTRGLREMVRFGTALGGEEATFYGLSGLGDLLATAYSFHSRNRGGWGEAGAGGGLGAPRGPGGGGRALCRQGSHGLAGEGGAGAAHRRGGVRGGLWGAGPLEGPFLPHGPGAQGGVAA